MSDDLNTGKPQIRTLRPLVTRLLIVFAIIVAAGFSFWAAYAVVQSTRDQGLRLQIEERKQDIVAAELSGMIPFQWPRGRYEGPDTLEWIHVDNHRYVFDGVLLNTVHRRGDTLFFASHGRSGRILIAKGHVLRYRGEVYQHVIPARPKPVPTQRAAILGAYHHGDETLFVLDRGAKLWALLAGNFYYPLAEVGSDDFRSPDVGNHPGQTFSFTRDAGEHGTQVSFRGITYTRNILSIEADRAFRITPVRPIDEIRNEARRATPPPQPEGLLSPDLVDLGRHDAVLHFDIRYATDNNFMGIPLYEQPGAYLQRPAARALLRAAESLRTRGLGLIIYDAYRPWAVTKMFWDATPNNLKAFVADPKHGSRHNRGCAVDLGLYDLKTGEPVEMPSGYDEFTPRALADYPGGSERARWFRDRLRDAMEAQGFAVYDHEWWHFDYFDWSRYPVLNIPFEDLEPDG